MENDFTVKDAALKNGVIHGLISIVIGLTNQILGLYESTAATTIIFVVSLGIMIYFFVKGHSTFKENNGGFMSFGQGVGIATLMSLVSGTLSSIFNYVYLSFVDDSALKFAKATQLEKFEEQGMDQAAIDTAMGMMETFSSPMAQLIFGIVGGVLIGLIIGLIVTIFTKKADPSLEI